METAKASVGPAPSHGIILALLCRKMARRIPGRAPVGDGCKLKNVEIEISIVMSECQIESGRRIVDSLNGNRSTIADGERRTRNVRLILGERSLG